MRSMLATLVVSLFLATSTALAAPTIVGDYAVKGANPGGKGQYQGSVNISKDGDTFHVKWTVGAETYIGTGILRGEVLAVAYTDSKGSWFGVVCYLIKDGGKLLDGQWTMAGGKTIGTEVLTQR